MPPASSAAAVPRINQHVKVETAASAADNANRLPLPPPPAHAREKKKIFVPIGIGREEKMVHPDGLVGQERERKDDDGDGDDDSATDGWMDRWGKSRRRGFLLQGRLVVSRILPVSDL